MNSIQAKIEAIIQKEWPKISVESKRQNLRWSYRLTPPIPSTWPVSNKSKITTYAFAAGMDPELRDGEVIAAPWGQVEYTVGDIESLRFVQIASKVSELKIQGVRPLSTEESKILKNDWLAALHVSLRTLSEPVKIDGPLEANTKKEFCLWFRLNSVITEELKKKQLASFYKSLGCDQ